MRTLMWIATFVTALAAGPLAADCKTAAGNLLAGGNCGFDRDVSGWSAVPEAKIVRDAGESGAMKAVGDPGGSLTVHGPCVAVRGGAQVSVEARLKLAEGSAYVCSVLVFEYDDAKCEGGAGPLIAAAAPPSAKWRNVSGSAKSAPATRAIEIRPVCSGEKGFAVLFDDFVARAN